LLRRCLEQDPAARFQKIRAVQKVLERLIHQPRAKESPDRGLKRGAFTNVSILISISLVLLKSALPKVMDEPILNMSNWFLSLFLHRTFLEVLDDIPLLALLLVIIPALTLSAARLDYCDWAQKNHLKPRWHLRSLFANVLFSFWVFLLVDLGILLLVLVLLMKGSFLVRPLPSPGPGSAQVRAKPSSQSSQLENAVKSEFWQVQGNEAVLTLPGGQMMEFVKIPAGIFMMGSPSSESGRDSVEGPQHRVTISRDFWMGKYEVTQAQWQAVMGSNPSLFNGDRNPVQTVSWNDCQEFRSEERRVGKECRSRWSPYH